MVRQTIGLLVVLLLPVLSISQDVSKDNLGVSVTLPSFNAKLSLGFNYDLLRAPTDVSFEYPQGFFGFNLPLEQKVNLRDVAGNLSPAADTIFSDTTLFTNGEDFRPSGSARQNPNMTVRVDVPMMGGVASFSNIQNCYLNYQNVLGNPSLFLKPDSLPLGMSFLMRGTINVPMNMTTTWETMTFGYAYRINKEIVFALNLHRHLFTMDLRARIDLDLLGAYNIDIASQAGSDLSVEIPPIHGELDYPSEKINGYAFGHYETEVWSPTLGLQLWRFTLTSRFGINTRAHGQFMAKYYLPFFIDPETFQPSIDFNDPEIFMDPEVRNSLLTNATDSVGYSTESALIWKMPQGHTIAFDIIRDMLSLSYTKLVGEMQMKISDIKKEKIAIESGSSRSPMLDSITVDFGLSVDHVMMLHFRLFTAYLNLGVFGMDFRYADRVNILGSAMIPEMQLNKMAMLPILNCGTALGGKLQLLLELDILPLPAFKTGIFYNF